MTTFGCMHNILTPDFVSGGGQPLTVGGDGDPPTGRGPPIACVAAAHNKPFEPGAPRGTGAGPLR
jgi:hypothetical protein